MIFLSALIKSFFFLTYIASQQSLITTPTNLEEVIGSPLDFLSDKNSNLYTFSLTSNCASSSNSIGILISKFKNSIKPTWNVQICPSPSEKKLTLLSSSYDEINETIYLSYKTQRQVIVRSISGEGTPNPTPISVSSADVTIPGVIKAFPLKDSATSKVFLLSESNVYILTRNGTTASAALLKKLLLNTFATTMEVVEDRIVVVGYITPAMMNITGTVEENSIGIFLQSFSISDPLESRIETFKESENLRIFQKSNVIPSIPADTKDLSDDTLSVNRKSILTCGEYVFFLFSASSADQEVAVYQYNKNPMRLITYKNFDFNGDRYISATCIDNVVGSAVKTGLLLLVQSGKTIDGLTSQYMVFIDTDLERSRSPLLVDKQILNLKSFSTLRFSTADVVVSSNATISRLLFGYSKSLQKPTLNAVFGVMATTSEPLLSVLIDTSCSLNMYFDTTSESCKTCNPSIAACFNGVQSGRENDGGLSLTDKVAIGVFVPVFFLACLFLFLIWYRRSENKTSDGFYSSDYYAEEKLKKQPSFSKPPSDFTKIISLGNDWDTDENPGTYEVLQPTVEVNESVKRKNSEKYLKISNTATASVVKKDEAITNLIKRNNSNHIKQKLPEEMVISQPTLISSSTLNRSPSHTYTLTPIVHQEENKNNDINYNFLSERVSTLHLSNESHQKQNPFSDINALNAQPSQSVSTVSKPPIAPAVEENLWTQMPNEMSRRGINENHLVHQNQSLLPKERKPLNQSVKPIGTEDLENLINALDEEDRMSTLSRAISYAPSWHNQPYYAATEVSFDANTAISNGTTSKNDNTSYSRKEEFNKLINLNNSQSANSRSRTFSTPVIPTREATGNSLDNLSKNVNSLKQQLNSKPPLPHSSSFSLQRSQNASENISQKKFSWAIVNNAGSRSRTTSNGSSLKEKHVSFDKTEKSGMNFGSHKRFGSIDSILKNNSLPPPPVPLPISKSPPRNNRESQMSVSPKFSDAGSLNRYHDFEPFAYDSNDKEFCTVAEGVTETGKKRESVLSDYMSSIYDGLK
ncbi:hypothetical protein HDU92_000476 [Lobulomyces angularis]|nr:hypothetical protein HDU92_000476 [Lobulomyces angularis]